MQQKEAKADRDVLRDRIRVPAIAGPIKSFYLSLFLGDKMWRFEIPNYMVIRRLIESADKKRIEEQNRVALVSLA